MQTLQSFASHAKSLVHLQKQTAVATGHSREPENRDWALVCVLPQLYGHQQTISLHTYHTGILYIPYMVLNIN